MSEFNYRERPGAKIIDLGSATLLPGLIDSHTHLLFNIAMPAEAGRARHSQRRFVPAQLLAIAESPSNRWRANHA